MAAHSVVRASRSAGVGAGRDRRAGSVGRRTPVPRQLLDVEGDAIRRAVLGGQLGAALLQDGDELDRLAVQGPVLVGRRQAEVGLQRDVTEVVEADQAERVGMVQDARHRQRHRLEQAADGDERHAVDVDRSGVEGEDERAPVRRPDADIAVGRVARQQHDRATTDRGQRYWRTRGSMAWAGQLERSRAVARDDRRW